MHPTHDLPPRDRLLDQLVRLAPTRLPTHGGDDATELLGRYVRDRQLDRVAARAAWLVSEGRLDPRDLRQLLPRSFGLAARIDACRPPEAGAIRGTPGVSVGRYKLGRLLGVGGSGTVFAARHPTLGFRVAVKVISDPARAAEAAAEAAVLTAVRHPNVVRLWDAGLSAHGHHLVLEYADRGSLAERLKGGRPVPPSSAFRIARQLLRGLRAVHRAGFTHGDVKPANVLRTAARTFLLADFGLAEPLAAGGRKSDRVHGSWAYMAPERFHEAGDHRADFYSLALTLVHLLTGRPPVATGTFAAAYRAHRKSQLDPLHWTVAGVTREQSAALLRMAAPDPAERATDFTDLLDAFRGGTARAPQSE